MDGKGTVGEMVARDEAEVIGRGAHEHVWLTVRDKNRGPLLNSSFYFKRSGL